MEIRKFEIDSYGTIKCSGPWKDGRSTTTEYNNVPTSIIKKFVSSSKSVDTKDLEDWIKAHRDKQNQGRSDFLCCEMSDFWTNKD